MSGPVTSRKHSFQAVVDSETSLLLLGSLPGEASLAANRYYGHPRNQFWRLVGTVIGQDLVAFDYASRLRILLNRGVGLWDVVASADRLGSLDAAIRNHRPNELLQLVASLPQLKAVAFNGATASRIGRRHLAPAVGLELIDLPSSSPALTTPIHEKQMKWMALREWVLPQRPDGKP